MSSSNAKEFVGGAGFKCTRGNCNDVLEGPHKQDEHNHSKHNSLATNNEVNKTYGEYSYNEVVR